MGMRSSGTFRILHPVAHATVQIPDLTHLGPDRAKGYLGKLVQFRAMVQDTLGHELFYSSNGGRSSMWSETTQTEFDQDSTSLSERSVLYCVDIPGQTEWAKAATGSQTSSTWPCKGSLIVIDHIGAGSPIDLSTLHLEKSTPSLVAAKKYPLPGVAHVGALVKVYSPDDSFKPTDVFNFIGILEETS